MLKLKYFLVLTAAIAVCAAVGYADCGSCGSKTASAENGAAGVCASACAASSCTTAACNVAKSDECKGCPIAAAMERLPKLTYAVGQKATCCPKEAAKLAKDSGGHVHYCVAGKEFDCEAEAQTALVEATEKFVAAFADPHKCPTSGQVTLAGQPQSCPQTAARTAKRMKEAMAKVNFTYLVGDKQSCCPKEAAKVAKETGEQKVFVVGEEKTCCEKSARLNLARAKYKAAVTAMVQAANEKSGS